MSDWKCCEAKPPEKSYADNELLIRSKYHQGCCFVNYSLGNLIFYIYQNGMIFNLEPKHVEHCEWCLIDRAEDL